MSSETTEPYPLAAVATSAAISSHAAEAAINGSEPGPAYIRAELISGGNAPKSNTYETPDSNGISFLATRLGRMTIKRLLACCEG